MGALPPEEEVSSSSFEPASSLLVSAQQSAEEERKRRLQAVFSQRIGASAKEMRVVQPPEAVVARQEEVKPKLMPGLSWDNVDSE